ncbi:hypothetical protein PIB30_073813, partial [Stylosanthes scabra]|nr:hypothetical protein [Stylosanthes scabra]
MAGCGLMGIFPPEIFQISTLSLIDISYNEELHGSFLDFPLMNGSLHTIRVSSTNFSGEGHEWYNSLLLLPHLQELSMAGCGLMGTFPPEIFQITTLSYIDISHNPFLNGYLPEFPLDGSLHTIIVSNTSFFGELPLSIGNMVHLSILHLSNCKFNGTIPTSLSNLRELKEIDLSHNNLAGPIPSSALSEGMQSLYMIDLSYNFISGSIPSSLFMIPSLESIVLSNNQFSKLEESTQVFSSKLEYLDLSCNNLSGPVPPSLFQLSGLIGLDLSSNNFSGSILIDALTQFKNLYEIDLSFNEIDDVNVTDDALSSFPQLHTLNLASCKLKTFPSFLRYQLGLHFLNLSYNQIPGTIPNWIWGLDNLAVLDVSHNLLTNLEGPFQNLNSELNYLFLQFNQLQGPIPSFSIGASAMDFSNNNFSGAIPRDIGYMFITKYLSLANNNLDGTIPDSLCGNTSELQVLDLSHNKISGEVPHCLMKLGDKLRVLNLGSNELTGHIPDTFPSSCVLHTIVFNGNQLVGPLPKSLEHCTALEVLDVGRNQIVGSFPCFLSHITTLRVLVLRNNKLHGPMGCTKGNCVWNMIQIIDVAFNNFSGELPLKWFKGWKKMISNDDEANSVPSHIQFGENAILPYYQDSVMVINKGQEIELVKILTIFTSIDFSYNQFEGKIPKELMDFKALHLLNLSHNVLSGQIPSSIGNLSQLESLDLSMNSLEGKIPTELVSLNFLSVLNLSFNHLTGRIPTGTQLQSFDASSFEGNDGLYGPPLTLNDGMHPLPPPPEMPPCGSLACEVHWDLVSAEVGLVFGLGIIIGPLLFWKRWRLRYCQFLDKVLCRIFPQLCHEYERRGGQTYRVL